MLMDPALRTKRRIRETIMVSLAWGATGFGLLILALILGTLLSRGLLALKPSVFTHITPPPGDAGGLLNAILGSLMMTGFGIAVAAPVGLLAGTWLAEYGRSSKFASFVRFLNDTLVSAPSIIIGLFIYGVVVQPMGHFSGWAGMLALALIAVPVIARTTEDVLNLVPEAMREAGVAIGAPRWRVIVSIIWRAALSGIVTGILLAVARISGETAPLLFTALNNQFISGMNHPLASLPVVIFQFAVSPYENWRDLAWAGALLIAASVLLLNIIARTLARKRTV